MSMSTSRGGYATVTVKLGTQMTNYTRKVYCVYDLLIEVGGLLFCLVVVLGVLFSVCHYLFCSSILELLVQDVFYIINQDGKSSKPAKDAGPSLPIDGDDGMNRPSETM